MKYLFHLMSLMLLFTVFTACNDDDQALTITHDIPFLSGGFSFDKAVLAPASTNADGTFKATLYLLEDPAELSLSGLTGLPADVMTFTFLSLPERGILPDGVYNINLPSNGGSLMNTYIKDNLQPTFNDLKFITSGTITVGTSGENRTFTLDVSVVNELNDQYNPSVEGNPLSGSVTVPMRVHE
jgi:hypothetical protein